MTTVAIGMNQDSCLEQGRGKNIIVQSGKVLAEMGGK